MCKSVLHKHATPEFITCCLTRELVVIIKIRFTEKKKSWQKAPVENVWGNNFPIKFFLAEWEWVFLFKIQLLAVIGASRTVCTLEKDSVTFTNLDFYEQHILFTTLAVREQNALQTVETFLEVC